ncbi:glutamate 5-kinase [Candidatus Uhrbacteria bacterium]|nr:glutamate 5-kinase [Candidatus Uhrbacteria bacterium]
MIIVKVGSDTLIASDGRVRREVIQDLLSTIAYAAKRGITIVLVSSGATKYGRHILDDARASIATAASVGQPALFGEYAKVAREQECRLAEILLTRVDLIERDNGKNIQKIIKELVLRGVIPIINENDAVTAGTGTSFGDNDSLAGALAIFLNVKKVIVLTNVDGLYDKNPSLGVGAQLISDVDDANTILLKVISGKISAGGRGGMLSKVKTARLCNAVGIEVQLVNGCVTGNLARALKGEKVGTVFHARHFRSKLKERERWMLAAKNSSGSIEIDEGAEKALLRGKSLLAVGVKRVFGQFGLSEIIEIINAQKHSIAVGLVKISSDELIPLLGTEKIHGLELIHTDNLILLK